jgi:hypothetical protein
MPFAKSNSRRSLLHVQTRMDRGIPVAMVLSAAVLACPGCNNSKAPPAPAPAVGTASAPPAKDDVLADVLRLTKAGDVDAALEQFVSKAPANWVESTTLADIRMSEAEFAAVSRGEQARLQQQFIERVQELNGLARTILDRAREARKRGDDESAKRYVEALNRFGEQLRDANTVSVFQQTGKALASMRLSE